MKKLRDKLFTPEYTRFTNVSSFATTLHACKKYVSVNGTNVIPSLNEMTRISTSFSKCGSILIHQQFLKIKFEEYR
jgi:hypothetical protein